MASSCSQSAQSKMACLLQLSQQGNAKESCFVEARTNRRKIVLARVQATLKPTKELVRTILQPGRPSQETYLLTYLLTNQLSQSDKFGKSANNSSMHNFCSESRADLKLHIHTQQRLENLSMKSVFDSVIPLFSCKDIFKTQNFAVTLYPLAIPS